MVKGSTTKGSQTSLLIMLDGGISIIGVVVEVNYESTNIGKVLKVLGEAA